jgi:transposase
MGGRSGVCAGGGIARGQSTIAIAHRGRGRGAASRRRRHRGCEHDPVVRRLAEMYDLVRCAATRRLRGYRLCRLITALGHASAVIAPSLIPRKPGEQVKTTVATLVTSTGAGEP